MEIPISINFTFPLPLSEEGKFLLVDLLHFLIILALFSFHGSIIVGVNKVLFPISESEVALVIEVGSLLGPSEDHLEFVVAEVSFQVGIKHVLLELLHVCLQEVFLEETLGIDLSQMCKSLLPLLLHLVLFLQRVFHPGVELNVEGGVEMVGHLVTQFSLQLLIPVQ